MLKTRKPYKIRVWASVNSKAEYLLTFSQRLHAYRELICLAAITELQAFASDRQYEITIREVKAKKHA